MSARVHDWLKADIEGFWRTHGAGPSAGLRHVAEEWWAMQRFPAIAFRDGVSGRRAHLRGGPDVWEVVSVARDYGGNQYGFYEHFAPFLTGEMLDQALTYAERFPDSVERMIEQNARIERMLLPGG
ncbi:hypothetical protein BH20GEM2_BH20GEM2_11000 [soil metagenome]